MGRRKKGSRKPHARRKARAYRKALQFAGQTGNLVGKAGERRVFGACSYGDFPSWWRGFRMGTKEEDFLKETDLVAETDEGDIPLQVKTSFRAKQGYCPERTEKGVPIVYICLSDSDVTIRTRVVNIITKEYERVKKAKLKTSQ